MLVSIGVWNLFKRNRTSLHVRFSFLCFALALSGATYAFQYLFEQYRPLIPDFLFPFFCWTTKFLYVSFLADMTMIRRRRYYFLLYALIVPLTIATLYLPRPVGLVSLIVVATLTCTYLTIRLLLFWIHSATDNRARRDGEWTAGIFLFFIGGAIISFFHTPTGFFWVLGLWMLIIHFCTNHLGIFRNLTDNENKLILDNVFDVVIILDSRGTVVRMNRRGYHVTGFSRGNVIGKTIETLIVHHDLLPATRREWLTDHAWLDTGGENRRSPSIDASLATKSGEEIPVDLRVVCLLDLSHMVSGYIVSATDMRITRQLIKEISDREYAARDLAFSESKFSRMFIYNPSGILILDANDLIVTDINPAMEEILELDREQLTGHSLSETGLLFSEMSVDSFVERVLYEGSVNEFYAQIHPAEGRTKKCRLSAVGFNLGETPMIILSATDMTSEEEMREALMRRQKVETVGILAGGIAHDFNNILAVVLGHIGLAKMRIQDKQARDPVERAEQACLRAREVTGQLLSFSRGGSPVLGVHDTRELITEFSQLAVEGSSVSCLFSFSPDLIPLYVDRVQVGQVISNLVKNAAQAMKNTGFVEIHCGIRDFRNRSSQARPLALNSKPVKSGMYVEIKIRDKGSGIPESVMEKIYDPFFSTKENGSGLGLTIVFSVVQNHGGAITVDSTPEQGTTFTLLLPGKEDASVSLSLPQELPVPEAEGSYRILVMDDDEQVLTTAVSLLASFGYTVDIAREGLEAVEKYRTAFEAGEPYHAAILDLVVPAGMSGRECAAQILAVDENAVLIVSSGYSDDPVLSRYPDYGFKGTLKKPYTLDEMKRSLLNVLVL